MPLFTSPHGVFQKQISASGISIFILWATYMCRPCFSSRPSSEVAAYLTAMTIYSAIKRELSYGKKTLNRLTVSVYLRLDSPGGQGKTSNAFIRIKDYSCKKVFPRITDNKKYPSKTQLNILILSSLFRIFFHVVFSGQLLLPVPDTPPLPLI